jgi:DNA-binding PadR family transcriptional regulator
VRTYSGFLEKSNLGDIKISKEGEVPIHHAVLGLLTDGPSYGYELKANFERAIGPQWGDLNVGHLYQVLDRLERDGMVTRRKRHQAERPDRVVLRLTQQGRGELTRWLKEPFIRQGGYRDDFFLKVFVASRLSSHTLQDVLRIQRESCLSELSVLADHRRAHRDDPLVSLLIEAALLHAKANLRVVDAAESRISELVESASRQVIEQDASHEAV